MKIKTSELSGVALDWAVAQALSVDVKVIRHSTGPCVYTDWLGDDLYDPSEDWAIGGPLIERFCSRLSSNGDRSGPDPETGNHYEDPFVWSSCVGFSGGYGQGKTALIAACRAIVASKLGDEVDVPEGLV